MKRFVVFVLAATALAACNKDKFKTTPTVTVNSLSPSDVVNGQLFTFNATVTDKEGDLQNTVLIVRKRFNGTSLLSVDTVRYNVAALGFPTKSEVEISAVFSYGKIVDNTIFQSLETADRNFVVGMVIIDKAGNRSDYAESGPIVLHKF